MWATEHLSPSCAACDHVQVIPRPFFDRPIQTDPLFWFGIVGGLTLSVIVELHQDAPTEDFIWGVVTGTFWFTWWMAGLLLSTIRHQFRRRRTTNDRPDEVTTE
jgi:hypothetical protein